jgi:hypothetical protein
MRWTMVLGRVDVHEDPLMRPVMAQWIAEGEPGP